MVQLQEGQAGGLAAGAERAGLVGSAQASGGGGVPGLGLWHSGFSGPMWHSRAAVAEFGLRCFFYLVQSRGRFWAEPPLAQLEVFILRLKLISASLFFPVNLSQNFYEEGLKP